MRPYSANTPDGVRSFAEALRVFPQSELPLLMSCICGAGLMKGPLWFRASARLVHRIPLNNAYFRFFSQGEKGMALAEDIREQTILWAIDGRDTVDEDSVGGFCQAEIDQIVGIMRVLLEDRSLKSE